MKKIKVFSILAIFIIGLFTLVSCKADVKATGEISVLNQTRYTLVVEAALVDNEKEVTAGSVQIQVYDKDGTRKVTSNCDKLGGDSETDSQQITIQALEENTTYTLKLVCTVKDQEVVLDTVETKTNKAGSSDSEPIHIKTEDDLKNIANDLSGYYILDNDIKLSSGDTAENGTVDLKEWTPLFTSSTTKAFTGTFDGNGHTISNFKQKSSYTDYGFFGYLAEGACVKNVNFKNVTIEVSRYSDTYIGIVAGRAEAGVSIANVNVDEISAKITTSTTTSKDFYLGGIVGQNSSGDIKSCSATNISLIAENCKRVYAGGIAGQNAMVEGTWIDDCVVSGKIEVKQEFNASSDFSTSDEIVQIIGGVVGKNYGRIKNTISKVDISGKFNLNDNIIEKVYANKDAADKSEDAPKEWKINNSINVAIGSFAGYNQGVIRTSATSGSINFDTCNAYDVEIGLFCGFNVSQIKPSINHVAYFNNESKINVKLVAGEADTSYKKEPIYDRVAKFTMTGKDEVCQNYFEMPSTYDISTCVEDLGTSTNISDFVGSGIDTFDADTFNKLIEKLKALF